MAIQWNTVTWYSKLAAVILFVGIFALAFYFGQEYQLIRSIRNVSVTPTPTTSTSTPVVPTLHSTSSELTLGVGQKGKMGDLEIKLNSVPNDYRCPVDVACIEAGAINTNITFTSGTQTVTKNMPSDEVPQEFAGYKISIVGINPPAMSKKQIPQSEYRINFLVKDVQKTSQGTLSGSVTLSPTCPMERMPPDPKCAPKPYVTDITITSAKLSFSSKISTNAGGKFHTVLPAGTYTITPISGKVLPQCVSEKVTIISGKTVILNLSCDTGIR